MVASRTSTRSGGGGVGEGSSVGEGSGADVGEGSGVGDENGDGITMGVEAVAASIVAAAMAVGV